MSLFERTATFERQVVQSPVMAVYSGIRVICVQFVLLHNAGLALSQSLLQQRLKPRLNQQREAFRRRLVVLTTFEVKTLNRIEHFGNLLFQLIRGKGEQAIGFRPILFPDASGTLRWGWVDGDPVRNPLRRCCERGLVLVGPSGCCAFDIPGNGLHYVLNAVRFLRPGFRRSGGSRVYLTLDPCQGFHFWSKCRLPLGQGTTVDCVFNRVFKAGADLPCCAVVVLDGIGAVEGQRESY